MYYQGDPNKAFQILTNNTWSEALPYRGGLFLSKQSNVLFLEAVWKITHANKLYILFCW